MMVTEQYNEDEIKKLVNSTKEYEFIKLTKTKENKMAIEIKHLKCGNTFIIRYIDFKRGRRCPFCNKRNKKSLDEVNEILKKSNPEYTCIEYNGMHHMCKFKHLTCGTIFNYRPTDMLKRHINGCPKCGKRITPNGGYALHDNEYIDNFLKEHYDQEFIRVSEYTKMTEPMTFRHTICGTEFTLQPKTLFKKNKNGEYHLNCPTCNIHTSAEEKTLIEFIKSIYDGKILTHYYYKVDKEYHELDIYLPELKIGFEYDGIYWHSDKFVDKKYHLNKLLFFKNAGVRVINIFSDEWTYKRDIVESKIKAILKKSDTERIYARKCIIKEIQSKEKCDFLNKYHLQGADKSKYNFGLFYDNRLVAVMTFSAPRISLGNKNVKSGEYELSRYATSDNVIGGFSKLLKYAINNISDLKYIKTYADLRYTDFNSNVYIKNGFKQVRISDPDYFYIHEKKRLHRFNFRKSVLKNKFPDIYSDDKTEFQIMQEAGYCKIFDCGNIVFEYKKQD